ncbi:SHOCT domain-containing protein [Saccharomonospora xinjiangensis]|uniref:SHOCT domain-containing protein n=1 Tax=Saccharomonospora xinjiangensis TaxID=75294 RepID=UPI003510AAC5
MTVFALCDRCHGGDAGMMGCASAGWIWVWFAMIVLLVTVVAGVVVWSVSNRRSPQGGDARRILDERFARGEIDEEEYRRRRAELR